MSSVKDAILAKVPGEAVFGSVVYKRNGHFSICNYIDMTVFYMSILPPMIHHAHVYQITREMEEALKEETSSEQFEGVKKLVKYASFVNDLALALLTPTKDGKRGVDCAVQSLSNLEFMGDFLLRVDDEARRQQVEDALTALVPTAEQAILEDALLLPDSIELLRKLLEDSKDEHKRDLAKTLTTNLLKDAGGIFKRHIKASIRLLPQLWPALVDGEQKTNLGIVMITDFDEADLQDVLGTLEGRNLLDKLFDLQVAEIDKKAFALKISRAMQVEEEVEEAMQEFEGAKKKAPIDRMLPTDDGRHLIINVLNNLPKAEKQHFVEVIADAALVEDNYEKTPLWWMLEKVANNDLQGVTFALTTLDYLPAGSDVTNDFIKGLAKALIIRDGTEALNREYDRKSPLQRLIHAQNDPKKPLIREQSSAAIADIIKRPLLNEELAKCIVEKDEFGRNALQILVQTKHRRAFLTSMYGRLSDQGKANFVQGCLNSLTNTEDNRHFLETFGVRLAPNSVANVDG